MAPQPLLMLVILGAVPVIAMMQDGAGIFAARPYAPVLWAGLLILAIVAVTELFGVPAGWRPGNGSPLLLTLPLIQASAFLASQTLFPTSLRSGERQLFRRKERTRRHRSSPVERPHVLGGHRLPGSSTITSCSV